MHYVFEEENKDEKEPPHDDTLRLVHDDKNDKHFIHIDSHGNETSENLVQSERSRGQPNGPPSFFMDITHSYFIDRRWQPILMPHRKTYCTVTADSYLFPIYRRKLRPRFTAAFRPFAIYRRKLRPQFTAAFRPFVFYRRKVRPQFTAAFRPFAIYRRKLGYQITAAFRSFVVYPVNGKAWSPNTSRRHELLYKKRSTQPAVNHS